MSSSPSATAQHSAPAPTQRRGLRETMGVAAIGLSVLTLTASGINYASNLIFSRLLTPASYGDLTALLALSVIAGVPLTAAQTRVAERVASLNAEGDWNRVRYTVRHAMAHLATIAVICTLIYCAAIPLVVKLLDLQAPGPAIALAPLIAVGFLFPVLQGALQGLERFFAFGLVLLGVAVSRIAFGVPWVEAGGGSGGAIAGQAVGMAACLAVMLWMLRGHYKRTGDAAGWAGMRRKPDVRAFKQGGAFVFYAVIANCDVVFAKLFLTSDQAGHYSAIATVGKVVAFLPAAIAVTVVPAAARARSSSIDQAKALRFGAALCLAASLLAAIPAALMPDFVISTMFGSDYSSAASGVLPIVVAGAGLSLLYLLVVFTVAIEDHRWTLLLALGVVLQAGGIALFHKTPTEVAVVQAMVVFILLLVNELLFHSLLRAPRATRA